MRKRLAFILVGIICTYLVPETTVGQTKQTLRQISVCSNCPGFVETLPATYGTATSKQFPLMIFLAGEGQLGNGGSQLNIMLGNGPPQLVASGQWPDSFVVNNRSFSYIIISPQFKAWPTDSDVDSVLKYALAHYRVDTGRVYMTGLSMGGGATWSYASSAPHAGMLAAIIPISGGTMWSGRAGAMAISQNNLAVFAATNRNDPEVNDTTTLQDIALINSIVPQCNPVALDTVYPASGHDAWTKTYSLALKMHNGLNAYQWMLQYSRDPGDTVTPPPPPPPIVTLSAYTASLTQNGKAVNVYWTTSLERGNRFFFVQRSADSINFVNLDTVASEAPPGGGASYQVTDAAPFAGYDYYRLVSVDTTGNSTFYTILKVLVPASAPPPPPLPPPPTVQLSAYNAALTTNDKAVIVNWTTQEETNNSYFIVQRSTDSLNFTDLGTIPSTAESGQGASYQYTDNSPVTGNDYYRLESVDSAGKDSILPVLLVIVPPPAATVLPVALTVYTATVVDDGNAVNVAWTTESEQGNKYFIVQHSTDSIQFSNLDTVAAEGGPETGASYLYTDSTPAPGNNYYRLQRFDITGNDTLYKVLKVETGITPVPVPSEVGLRISPNPATGLLYIHLVDSVMGAVNVSLTDMEGRLLRVWEFQKQDLVWDQSVEVSNFARGIYVLRIQGTAIRFVRMVLKE
jgi:hypothetical protein